MNVCPAQVRCNRERQPPVNFPAPGRKTNFPQTFHQVRRNCDLKVGDRDAAFLRSVKAPLECTYRVSCFKPYALGSRRLSEIEKRLNGKIIAVFGYDLSLLNNKNYHMHLSPIFICGFSKKGHDIIMCLKNSLCTG